MKLRSWTPLMTALGLLTGVSALFGFPKFEDRRPASVGPLAFSIGAGISDHRPDGTTDESRTDRRRDVLFDLHAPGGDAYVIVRFRDDRREEITRFSVCARDDAELDRYSPREDGYPCIALPLPELREGHALFDSDGGSVLRFRLAPGFDPREGGILFLETARHFTSVGENDFRSFAVSIDLNAGVAHATGPRGERFDWMNLEMPSEAMEKPSGVFALSLFAEGHPIANYSTRELPRSISPR